VFTGGKSTLENTEGSIKNGQSRQDTRKTKQKYNAIFVGHH